MNTCSKWGNIYFAAWDTMSNPEYQEFQEHSINSKRMQSAIDYTFGYAPLIKELAPSLRLPFIFNSAFSRKYPRKNQICIEVKH